MYELSVIVLIWGKPNHYEFYPGHPTFETQIFNAHFLYDSNKHTFLILSSALQNSLKIDKTCSNGVNSDNFGGKYTFVTLEKHSRHSNQMSIDKDIDLIPCHSQ